MSEWSFIIGAYAVAWAGLAGYALRLVALDRRARRLLRMAGGEE